MRQTLWVTVHAVLIFWCLNIFDIVLRKRLADSPEMFIFLLVVLFALIAFLVQFSRRSRKYISSSTKVDWDRLTPPSLLLFAFFLILLFLFHDSYSRAGSDGREYFVQVRSLVMDWDLDFRNDAAAFGSRGTAERYAFGGALLWAPFFALCHLWLGLLNFFGMELVRDGYSNPYQMAIGLGTLIYGCVGLLLMWRVLRDVFSEWLAVVTVITLCAGSFIIWYLTVENSMVHGVSMFSTTLFLYLWYRSRFERSLSQWVVLGAVAGLMTMTRWQNALFVVFPITDALYEYWTIIWKSRSRVDRALIKHVAFVMAGAFAFFPQLWFWYRVRGDWFSAPVTEHGVSWSQAEIGEVLYSAHHGLFSATPIMYAATLGAIFFACSGRDRRFGVLLVLGFLAQLYVNSTVENWWGGAGFGARRFSNCALFFSVGLATFLGWIVHRPKLMLGSALVLGVGFNYVVMQDVRRGDLPADEAIAFNRMADSMYTRLGNPFSFPLNAIIGQRFGGGWDLYDRLGSRAFNNFRLDVGSSGDKAFLLAGWSIAEESRGESFRWSSGLESGLVFRLKESANYQLNIRCEPFIYPGSGTQMMEVIVNDYPVESLELHRQWHDYSIELPSRIIARGLNKVEFKYLYAGSPQAIGISSDSRELAVRFESIELIR